MRISDWSSDVCSSDLSLDAVRPERAMERCLVVLLLCCVSAFASASGGVRVLPQDSGVDVRLRGISAVDADVAWASGAKGKIGRASCRERVCQYVYISVVAVSLKKKKTQHYNDF